MHDARHMHERHPPVDLIGSAEACALLGIDRSTLTRRVARGDIRPAGKLAGPNGALIFRRDVIEAAK